MPERSQDSFRASRRAAFDQAYPGLGDSLSRYAGQRDKHRCKTFMAQMAEELAVCGRLTVKQAAAVQRSLSRRDEGRNISKVTK